MRMGKNLEQSSGRGGEGPNRWGFRESYCT
jgi:hypothetical protein